MTAKKKILHVEDDRNMQMLVRAILETGQRRFGKRSC